MPVDVEIGQRIWPIEKQPNEVALLAFSAATWNLHRIHFDRDYAVSEGHRDVVVHGSLQANWLVEAVLTWQPTGVLRSLSFRNVSTAYVNESFNVAGVIEEVSLLDFGIRAVAGLTVEGPSGTTTMGRAVVDLFDAPAGAA